MPTIQPHQVDHLRIEEPPQRGAIGDSLVGRTADLGVDRRGLPFLIGEAGQQYLGMHRWPQDNNGVQETVQTGISESRGGLLDFPCSYAE